MDSRHHSRLPPVPEHLRDPRVTKTEAACRLGIARSSLYVLISQGVIPVLPDGRIDVSKAIPAYEAHLDRIEGRRW